MVEKLTLTVAIAILLQLFTGNYSLSQLNDNSDLAPINSGVTKTHSDS